MTNEIKIIDKLPVERWEEYKNLRLEALKTDPSAFWDDLDFTIKEEDNEWKNVLERNLIGEEIIIFAEYNNKLIGMGTVYLYEREDCKHNATLKSLYVSPQHRGRGIGEMLVNRRIELILLKPYIRNIFCEIFGYNVSSIELHKKLGFEEVGSVKDFILLDGKYFDSLTFQKRFGQRE
jgi:L-amino acid N-acyltransferase YncA